MDLGLKGKTAIITAGGGRNYGGETLPLTLAEEGVEVVMADIASENAEKVAEKIRASGGKAIAVKTDVTKYEEVEAAAKRTLDEFGKIDILVNVAGRDRAGLFIETTAESREWIINLNYWGMINCCHVVLPHMCERRSGVIVSIASDAGRMGEFREGVYAGCKAAQIGLSKTIAREGGRYGVRANVICPGAQEPLAGEAGRRSTSPEEQQIEQRIRNILYPLRRGRMCTPADIADAVTFLVSDRATWITGQTLSVSGGYTMM